MPKKIVSAPVFIKKEDGQEYGYVTKMLGDGKVRVLCYDKVERLGVIRGSMRHKKHKVWIAEKDHVLVSFCDFTEKKCYVVHKYSPEDVRRLKKMGELPEMNGVVEAPVEQEDIGFEFDEI